MLVSRQLPTFFPVLPILKRGKTVTSFSKITPQNPFFAPKLKKSRVEIICPEQPTQQKTKGVARGLLVGALTIGFLATQTSTNLEDQEDTKGEIQSLLSKWKVPSNLNDTAKMRSLLHTWVTLGESHDGLNALVKACEEGDDIIRVVQDIEAALKKWGFLLKELDRRNLHCLRIVLIEFTKQESYDPKLHKEAIEQAKKQIETVLSNQYVRKFESQVTKPS